MVFLMATHSAHSARRHAHRIQTYACRVAKCLSILNNRWGGYRRGDMPSAVAIAKTTAVAKPSTAVAEVAVLWGVTVPEKWMSFAKMLTRAT